MGNLFIGLKWKQRGLKFNFVNKAQMSVKTDYSNPGLTWQEEVICFLEGLGIVILFSYFFYRSMLACIVLSPGIWIYRKRKKKILWKKRKEKLEIEFKETLLSVQTNLQSGYAIENAFLESYGYVVSIFGTSSDMARELLWIKKGLANKDTLEHLMTDFGKRCPGSAIEDFSNIFSVICKTGGNWNEIISKIVGNVTQKMELQEEISILIHGKKTESRVMCLIPFFILFYMDTTSKGYFDVMYHNMIGIVIMTLCMVAYIAAFLMAEKITKMD